MKIVGMDNKVAVVGVGAVGQACAFALILRGSAREIVLVDRTAGRAAGVATDMRYGLPLSPTTDIAAGDWSDLAGAGVVLICAGVNEKSGGATDRSDDRGRLKLLDTNASVYRDVVPRIVAEAPEAVLLAVTDSPDPLADLTRTLAGQDRVLSTGTTIDTLRFRVQVAAELGVHPSAVEGLVVGEHGTSEVMLWSSLRVAGTPLADALGADDSPTRSASGSSARSASRTSRSSRATAPANSASVSPARRSPRRSCATTRRAAGGGVSRALRRHGRAADRGRARGSSR